MGNFGNQNAEFSGLISVGAVKLNDHTLQLPLIDWLTVDRSRPIMNYDF